MPSKLTNSTFMYYKHRVYKRLLSVLIIVEMGAGLSQPMKLPHNYEAILKDADMQIDKSSMEKLYEQLYAGVFLNKKQKASIVFK